MAATDSDIQASGGDYTTTAAWHTCVPSPPTGLQRGLLAAEAFSITADQSLSGKTLSAGNEVQLTTQTDASVFDVSPFVLGYSTSHARITTTDGYRIMMSNADEYTKIDKIQWHNANTGNGATGCLRLTGTNPTTSWFKNVLLKNDQQSDFSYDHSGECRFINCICICEKGGVKGFGFGYDGRAINCGAIHTEAVSSSTEDGFVQLGGTVYADNCYSFGFNDDWSGTWSGDYNASDLTSAPGANSTDSITFDTSAFTSITVDFTLPSGSSLIAAANTDATYSPNDCIETVRGSGTAGDVGPHEFVAAAGGNAPTGHLAGPLFGSLAGPI